MTMGVIIARRLDVKTEEGLCSVAKEDDQHLLLLHLGSFWRQGARLLRHLSPPGAKPKQVSFSLGVV